MYQQAKQDDQAEQAYHAYKPANKNGHRKRGAQYIYLRRSAGSASSTMRRTLVRIHTGHICIGELVHGCSFLWLPRIK